MSTNGTFAMAFKFYTLGYSVISSGGGNKKKAPLVNWTEYQSRPATAQVSVNDPALPKDDKRGRIPKNTARGGVSVVKGKIFL